MLEGPLKMIQHHHPRMTNRYKSHLIWKVEFNSICGFVAKNSRVEIDFIMGIAFYLKYSSDSFLPDMNQYPPKEKKKCRYRTQFRCDPTGSLSTSCPSASPYSGSCPSVGLSNTL